MIKKDFLFFLCIVVMLAAPGCSEERVIGQGENSLIFDNQGDIEIALEVSWTSGGEPVKEEFTVFINETVTLKLDPNNEYTIVLAADCSDTI